MVPNPLAGTVIKVFKGYYRIGRDAEGFGGLPEGQMATLAQALEVRFEFVVATDPQHTVRIECKVMAAAMSALVEDVGDLGIDVFFEQRVDLGNDRFGGTVFEVGGEFACNGQCAGGTGAQPHTECEGRILFAGDGDVFNQQTDHALAFTVRCFGIVPQARKVGGEVEDFLALFIVEFAVDCH